MIILKSKSVQELIFNVKLIITWVYLLSDLFKKKGRKQIYKNLRNEIEDSTDSCFT